MMKTAAPIPVPDVTEPSTEDSQARRPTRSVRPVAFVPEGSPEILGKEQRRRDMPAFSSDPANRHWGINE